MIIVNLENIYVNIRSVNKENLQADSVNLKNLQVDIRGIA